MREVGPHVVHEGSGAGALVMRQAYIVMDPGTGRWDFNTTGPAEAYWKLDPVSGRYFIDPTASSHDTEVFLQIGTGRVMIR